MAASSQTFPCPFCAEQILEQAVQCRFCGRDVIFRVTLERKPPQTRLSDLTTKILETFGEPKVGSYGAIRKRMAEPHGDFVMSWSHFDAKRLLGLIEESGGKARVIAENPESEVTEASAGPISRGFIWFGLASAAVGAAAYWAKLPRPESRPPIAESSPTIPPTTFESTRESTRTTAEFPPPETQDPRAHLQALIQATATLTGNGVTGSAFFIHSDGYLLTNDHVSRSMTSISVMTSDGRTRPAVLIRNDPTLDLALIKAEGDSYPTLRLGDATTLEQGETVWTIGAPHGLSFTVTKGIVSFVGRNIGGKAFVQADVAINPGNSGGPMINEKGEVVGVNNFIISNAVGLNFAIPINYAYSGGSAITGGVLPATPDNATMAAWRAFGRSTSADVAFRSSPNSPGGPSPAEIDLLRRDAQSIQNDFREKRTAAEAEINRLQSELGVLQDRYREGEPDISAESELGRRVSQIRQEILRREISLLDDTVEYTERAEGQITRLHDMLTDPTGRADAQSQITALRSVRSRAVDRRTIAQQQLRAEQERTY